MAFLFYQSDDGRAPAIEYLPCSAMAPKLGMALVQSAGNLAKCGATAAPAYISLCEYDSAVAAGTIIPVMRVGKDVIYKTTSSAAMTSIKLGTKVTLHTDGLQVTATSTDGVAEVVGIDDTAAGGDVYVRF